MGTMGRLAPVWMVAAGCDFGESCECAAPDGPGVDMVALQGEVAAFAGGMRTGTVVDAAPEEAGGARYEPCAIAGEAFTVVMVVGEPRDCLASEDDTGLVDACGAATSGYFPMAGTLTVGDAPAKAVHGFVWAESWESGVAVSVELEPPAADFPHQTLDADLDGDTLGDARLEGLRWGRRLSEDDGEAVWEVCALPFE